MFGTSLSKHVDRNTQLARKARGTLNLFDEMNDMFDEIFNYESLNPKHLMLLSAPSTRSYVVDVKDDDLFINLDVPGVKPEDLSVSVQGNELTVNATRSGRKATYSWLIRQDYDASAPTAQLQDGVLTIVLKKKQEAKSHEIKIDVVK